MKLLKTTNKSLPLKPITLGVIAVLATGCATTQPYTASNSADAQSALGDAMAGQLRSSFGYQTDVYVSNAIREDALANASDEQKQASEDKSVVCEDEHDRAYIALTKKLMAEQGKKAEDITAGDEHEAIKQAYKDCLDARGDLTGLKEFDFEAFFDKTTDMDAESQFDLLYQEMQAFDQDAQSTQPKSDYLPDYDSDHTALDAKKAELAKAYLFEPTHIQVKGQYQPLVGVFTALPSFDYQAKNISTHLNQPIHVDLKNGDIYLWADNFAMINSELLDKKLGNQWQNKWLKLPLNDGSLPDDFAKTFMKLLIQAKKESFLSLGATSFRYVDADTVLQTPYLSQNLPTDALSIIQKSPTIVQSNPSEDAKRFADYVFADTLYNGILQAYPQLVPQMTMDERVIADGESLIVVSEVATAEPSADAQPTTKLNSKLMLNLLLAYLAGVSDNYISSPNATNTSTPYAPLSHYGIQGNRVNWIHQRQYLTKTNLKGGQLSSDTISSQQPVLMDLFTTITPSPKRVFERLPAHAVTPTDANSVNLFDYSNELIERLKTGDDKYLKAMLALITGESEAPSYDETELLEPSDTPVDAPIEPVDMPDNQ